MTDEAFMRAALAFGRRHLGATGTNPAVGAILVKDEVIVGRGATRPGGRPHAETLALAQAGDAACGATLYVTLEPCSHHGVTPPCADAVVRASVARVVSAMEDPDPRVAGRGHRRLREAGIETIVGVCAEEARRAHRGHISRATEGRPMVAVKLAETADGFAGGDVHDARLRITGPAADNRVHALRALHDAIMIGAGTARADDPLLTVRLPGMEALRPLRIALDSRASLPLRSRLASTAKDWPTLVVVGDAAPEDAVEALAGAGVRVERVADADGGGVRLDETLKLLAGQGVMRILCEGGPRLASALILEGFADECFLFRGPMPLARPGLPALSVEARAALTAGETWRLIDQGFAGQDRWERFERVA